MIVLGIDPGPIQSGIARFDSRLGEPVRNSYAIIHNDTILDMLASSRFEADVLAFEMIASYGMAVGESTFETVLTSGRFVQQWMSTENKPAFRVKRMQVKMHICGSSRAKDANINQALRDRFGEPGTKKQPGLLYGCTKHAWSALAVAITLAEGGTGEKVCPF